MNPLLSTPNPGTSDDLGGATGPSPSDQPLINDPGAKFLGKTALETRLEGFRGMALAPNTLRGYQTDWTDFAAWCEEQGRDCLPAATTTVSLYFADRSEHLTAASLTRRIAAISKRHAQAGFLSPTKQPEFREVMAGIRKSKKDRPQTVKAALLNSELIEILGEIEANDDLDRLQAARDRALLIIGFAGALRRSELVNLDVEDIVKTRDGIILTLRWSKTDQQGQGTELAIPKGRKPATCPVTILETWLTRAKIKHGPVFRKVRQNGVVENSRLSDRSVALILKRCVGHAGFAPEEFSGHSLRAGFATSAASAGANERDIMQHTRHKSEQMVRRYIRKGSLFKGNLVDSMGF
jgi:integrase